MSPPPRPPRYGQASLADLVPAASLAVRGHDNVLGLDTSSRVILLVVDGLGWHQLAEAADTAPLLASLAPRHIDAVFPSTTVTCLSSIGTGLTPGEHGLIGFALALPDHDEPFNVLRWQLGPRGARRDAREILVPEEFQPAGTAFEQAGRDGVHVTTIIREELISSGLTRAGLRGGHIVTALSLEDTLDAAGRVARSASGPTLVYAHHGDVDTAGHTDGPLSERWHERLAELDDALTRRVQDLPDDVTLLITADHGMVASDLERTVELSEEPFTAGVRLVAGEPRVRYVATLPGATDDVAAAWREGLGEDFEVVTRDELIAAGWYGPTIAEHVLPRIPELIVLATGHRLATHEGCDPQGGRLPGMHGSITPAEIAVPLLQTESMR